MAIWSLEGSLRGRQGRREGQKAPLDLNLPKILGLPGGACELGAAQRRRNAIFRNADFFAGRWRLGLAIHQKLGVSAGFKVPLGQLP